MTEDYIEWPSATQKGYMEAHEGDGIVMQRPHAARGTVQPQQSPTLTTQLGGGAGVVVKEDSGMTEDDQGIVWPSLNGRTKVEDGDGVIPTRPFSVRKSVLKDGTSFCVAATAVPAVAVNESVVRWPCDTVRGNSSGYMEAHEGDGLVMSRPSSSGSTVKKDMSPTLKTHNSTGVVTNENGTLRIRYLTPRECLRLMGQSEDAIDCLMAVEPSKARQYKAAGNSIVVDVLVDIFRGIYIDKTFGKIERRPRLEDYL